MVITRVAPLSVAKVAGVIYALLGLIFGAIVSLASLAGAFAASRGDTNAGLVGALFGIGAVVLLPLFYGCMGFIMSLITAALYNAVSGVVGGVEIDVR